MIGMLRQVRWFRFLRRAARDRDAVREIASYIAIETDENIARGMSPERAREAAVRKFGNTTRVREEIYWMNTIRPIDALWQDIRYAIRLLRRDKAFAVAAVLSLALGIGANTAIFQLLDAVRLRTLPVERPNELVEVRLPPGTSRSGDFTGRRAMMTYALFDEIRQKPGMFSGLFAWSSARLNTASGGEVRRIETMWVSGETFSVLGLKPIVGRLLTSTDDRPGCPSPGVVLSYAYWQREFGGAPSVLQQTVRLEGARFDIIGVAPPDFFGLEVGRRFDVAVPLCADPILQSGSGRLVSRRDWWLSIIGRLAPGRTAEQVSQQLAAQAPGIMEATVPPGYPADDDKSYRENKLMATAADSGVSGLRTQFGESLVVLLAATGLVLLIACANLANLLLARATTREREIAVRLAIGASRKRVVFQLLVESVVLALAGTVLAVVFARGLTTILVAQLATGQGNVFIDLSWNTRVFGFTSGVAVLACLFFGLAPALKATSLAPSAALKSGGRAITAGRERFGMRRTLVVTQVAMSLVLLIGALLFTRTLYNLLTIDTGFDQRVIVAYLTGRSLAGDVDRGNMVREQIRTQLSSIPGVTSVALSDYPPLGGNFWNESIHVDGLGGDRTIANFARIGEGYFGTLGIRLVAGRDFDQRDTRTSVPVAIVNQTFVRKVVADRDPIGLVVRLQAAPGEPEPAYQIVGVSADAKHTDLRRGFEPLVLLPAAQISEAPDWTRFVIRPRAGLEGIMPAVVGRVAEVSPEISIEFSVLEQTIRGGLMRERLMAALSAAFGVLAGLLAAIGLYGVMSYTVTRRSSEIGIRLAMGARRADVLRMIVREGGLLVGIGLAIGTGLGLGAAHAARSLLFGLQPTDPATIGGAVILLGVIGLAASFLPARRASKLDPAVVLRNE
jgi:putative ABC transport system permease protein